MNRSLRAPAGYLSLAALLVAGLAAPAAFADAPGADEPPSALVAAVEVAVAQAARVSATGEAPAGLAEAVAAALTEDEKLTASDPDSFDRFGISVSLSGDRALVGAPGPDDVAVDPGVAYIFAFDGASWAQEARITAPDASARFGRAVSLSDDRALVGAPGLDDVGVEPGAAYVFAFDGAAWVEEARLTASDADEFGFSFGISVSLSGDRALVGASLMHCVGGENCGAAYVFAFDGTSWSEEARLSGSDVPELSLFGISVSLSENRALVGAPRADCPAVFDCGATYVFAFDGAAWSEEARLTASDASRGDRFGFSVSLSGDRALVGSDRADCVAGSNCGAAYVFAFDGAAWSEEVRLSTTDVDAGEHFGSSVSLSGDRALIGASGVDCAAGENCGAAYVFAFDGSTWAEDEKLSAAAAAAGAFFGTSVSLSGDRALIGAYGVDCAAGTSCGAAYVFELPAAFNQPPVADAGPDQTVIAGQTVTLDGSASYDPDGDALTYAWTLTGPGSPDLSDASAVDPSFCAAEPGNYAATLTVSDGTDTDTDDTQVTALSARDALGTLIADVEALGSDGSGPLNSGQVRALTQKLEQARRLLGQGRTHAAIGVLGAFDNQVRAFEAAGLLSSEQAAALAATAEALEAVIQSPCSLEVASAEGAGELVASPDGAATIPEAFSLPSLFPNPASASSTLRLGLVEAGHVRVALYDVTGREVMVALESTLGPGWHEAAIDVSRLAAGVYVVRATIGTEVVARGLTVLR